MYGSPHKSGAPSAGGYYMVDRRQFAPTAFYPAQPEQYQDGRFPAGPVGYVPAQSYAPPQQAPHPHGAHHPYMPWTPHDQMQPVYVQTHPDFHPQIPVNEGSSHRAESIASSDASSDRSSKKSSGKGRKSPQSAKYGSIKHKQSSGLQLAEIEEMAQQAERMRISDKKASRDRRSSAGSGECDQYSVSGGSGSSGSSGDSGHGTHYNEEGHYEVPDEELVEKIIDQVEYYLSDEYLAKDKYLLRQIRCKSEGYISIKLMTSFKKVKKLTRDWQVVRHALKLSPQLEVSPEGYRVKRRDNLPETLRKPRLLTSVVAIRVPPEFDSVDMITSLFRAYGEIGLVRLLRPGKEVPSDLRNYATQVPDIGDSLCAVVDFEGSDAALKAVRELKEQFSEDDSGMRLALLGPRMRRTLYRQDRLAAQGKLGSEDGSVCDGSTTSEDSGENNISCKDSGHGEEMSEISDEMDGKLSPLLMEEKHKSKLRNSQSNQVREPTGPTNGGERGFGLSRRVKTADE